MATKTTKAKGPVIRIAELEVDDAKEFDWTEVVEELGVTYDDILRQYYGKCKITYLCATLSRFRKRDMHWATVDRRAKYLGLPPRRKR